MGGQDHQLGPLGGTYTVYLRPSDKQMEVQHCVLKLIFCSRTDGWQRLQ
jgi:hypothetical protein